MRRKNSGMTYIELLIMVVVLGVVTAIAYPKFKILLYQSREARTKTRLGDLRGAVAIYYSDNKGLYPPDSGTPETRLRQYIVPKYLKDIPYVDLKHIHSKKLNTVQDQFNYQGDWMYTTLGGFVAVNSDQPDTEGISISNW